MTGKEARGAVGQVSGTEDPTPLLFWVALHPDSYLQLDDVVALSPRLGRPLHRCARASTASPPPSAGHSWRRRC